MTYLFHTQTDIQILKIIINTVYLNEFGLKLIAIVDILLYTSHKISFSIGKDCSQKSESLYGLESLFLLPRVNVPLAVRK
jgi:hypothetical protein